MRQNSIVFSKHSIFLSCQINIKPPRQTCALAQERSLFSGNCQGLTPMSGLYYGRASFVSHALLKALHFTSIYKKMYIRICGHLFTEALSVQFWHFILPDSLDIGSHDKHCLSPRKIHLDYIQMFCRCVDCAVASECRENLNRGRIWGQDKLINLSNSFSAWL